MPTMPPASLSNLRRVELVDAIVTIRLSAQVEVAGRFDRRLGSGSELLGQLPKIHLPRPVLSSDPDRLVCGKASPLGLQRDAAPYRRCDAFQASQPNRWARASCKAWCQGQPGCR